MNFEGRKKGTLQIFRQAKEVEAAEQDIAVLERYGVPYRRLKPEECAEFEPALARVTAKIAGGLHLPADATGDCHLFTENLYKLCQEKGVQFHFNQTIRRIDHNGLRIKPLKPKQGGLKQMPLSVRSAASAGTVLAQLDLNLPIYPVKGYSLTLPVTNSDGAPVSTVLDESYKVAITRFDNRIRVGGMAELSGYEIKLPEKRRETLALVVNDLFPEGGDLNQALFWSGLRPMTPDSTPLIGCTRFDISS